MQDDELTSEATVRYFRTVQTEGNRYVSEIKFGNMIK